MRIGLAKFTRIVLPKSSDSFCRGKRSQQSPPKTPVPPKSLLSSADNRASSGLAQEGRATRLCQQVERGPYHVVNSRCCILPKKETTSLLSLLLAPPLKAKLSVHVPQRFVAIKTVKGSFSQTASTPVWQELSDLPGAASDPMSGVHLPNQPILCTMLDRLHQYLGEEARNLVYEAQIRHE